MNAEEVARRLLESAALKERVARELSGTIAEAGRLFVDALRAESKLVFFGNGGSAADAQHLAAEFVGHYGRERAPLAAIALSTDTSALTAIGNDYGFDQVFARQLQALARRGDVAVAISTSGRSPNILRALEAARSIGLATVVLTGEKGAPLASNVDVAIVVPSSITARIQECHIAIGHVLCEYVDAELSGGFETPQETGKL